MKNRREGDRVKLIGENGKFKTLLHEHDKFKTRVAHTHLIKVEFPSLPLPGDSTKPKKMIAEQENNFAKTVKNVIPT